MFDASKWCDDTLGGGSGPFVIDCADCPVGLSIEEQIAWAMSTSHPMMEFPKVQADQHWWNAIEFETQSTLAELDKWRQAMLDKYTKKAAELEFARVEWLKGVPRPLKTMMKNVHGPLISQ